MASITLTYDETLDSGSVPATTDFAVTVNGTPNAVTSVGVVGALVTLGLTTPPSPGDTVLVSYTPGGSPIQDIAGNDAAALAGEAVTGAIVATFPANLAALQAANAPGSTIIIPAGNNGNQTISDDKAMIFRGATGAVLGDVVFATGAGNVTLENMTVNTVQIGDWQSSGPGETPPTPVTGITLTNVSGILWKIRWSLTTTITGGSWGNVAGRCEVAPIQPWDGLNVPTDVLVEDGTYHDFFQVGSQHAEAILIYGANGVTVRGCTFLRCGSTGDVGLFFVDAPGVAADDFIALANIAFDSNTMSYYWTGTPGSNVDAFFNMQISNVPVIPGLVDPLSSGNVFHKLAYQSNGAPFTFDGINWFARSVPGGTPKAPAAPAGWGR